MSDKKDFEKYGVSEQGNFSIKDKIGVPHPYCITPKHVAVAADHHGGILGESAIEDAESRGARCGMRGCTLTYKEHEQALLVACKVEIEESKEELQDYLISIKEQAEKDGYAGFAFMKTGE